MSIKAKTIQAHLDQDVHKDGLNDNNNNNRIIIIIMRRTSRLGVDVHEISIVTKKS
jgi:hypothetical protein